MAIFQPYYMIQYNHLNDFETKEPLKILNPGLSGLIKSENQRISTMFDFVPRGSE